MAPRNYGLYTDTANLNQVLGDTYYRPEPLFRIRDAVIKFWLGSPRSSGADITVRSITAFELALARGVVRET